MSYSLGFLLFISLLLLIAELKAPWHPPQRSFSRIRTSVILLVISFISMGHLAPFGFNLIFKYIGPINRTAFDLFGGGHLRNFLKFFVGILIIDFKNFWFHKAIHQVQLLWRFHRCHHSDSAVDIFTTQRFHPVELLFGFLPAMIPVLLGVPLISFSFLELVGLPWVLWQHSNITMPRRLEKFLSYLFVTPRMHKLHHSIDPVEANVNYGVIFSFWDRAFGSFSFKSDQELKALTFGVQNLDKNFKSDSLLSLLRLPLIHRRE